MAVVASMCCPLCCCCATIHECRACTYVRVPLDAIAAFESCMLHLLLVQGAIDDRFIEYLAALSEKIKFCSGQKPTATPTKPRPSPDSAAAVGAGEEVITLEDLGILPAETLAGRDTLPELERLRVKAATRVRDGRCCG